MLSRFSPVFISPLAPVALWRLFWPLVLIGLALRLLAAITGDWTMRPDELFQYLEQAHRIVFGYGQIPWEFRFGERTWLLPMLSVPPLWLCKVLGFDSPEQYAPVVRSFHAALSMLIPVGMYFFTRRVHSETAARCALVLGSCWHELIITAPHPIAESSSSVFVFAALAAMTAKMTTKRVLACGFFLGMAFVFRIQYAPTIGLIGLALLFYADNRGRIALVSGGILAILLAGLVDYLYWGRFWHTYINYFNLQLFSDFNKYIHQASGNAHLRNLFIGSVGLYYVVALAALFYYRRLWFFIVLVLSVQVTHNIVANKEYVNTFLSIPFLLLMTAGVIAQWGTSQTRNVIIAGKDKAIALLAAFILTTIAGLGAWLPYQQELFVFGNNKALFFQHPAFAVNLALSKEPAEKMKAIVWLPVGADTHYFGGYYYTHHDVPMYFPLTSDYDRKLLFSGKLPENDEARRSQDNAILAQAGTFFAESASHLVLPAGLSAEGFELLTIKGGLGIHVNNNPERVKIIPGASYDILANNIVGILDILHKLRVVDVNNTPIQYNKNAIPKEK